ncbi:hypothetical protein DFP95_1076 [Cohnella lupini]|uniref:Uncharacterized protein n=2 Tax=Cohnella lupini TaxID=1294267 RepID=A0A3D9IBM3_9BACL|nr:hypothetical protein DFP95_1076 [Cohnella lupini]
MEEMNSTDLDNSFSLNRNSYSTDFLPVYVDRGIVPQYLIQFPVLLPFELPFKNGLCNTFVLENGDGCTLHFSEVLVTDHIHPGVVSTTPLAVEICKTRVEMTYVSANANENPLVKDIEYLSEIFDVLVDSLNWIISAYQLYKKDIHVHQVSREMFEFTSLARIIPVNDWDNTKVMLFLTNLNVKHKKEKLNDEQQYEVIRHASIIFTESNPFILSEELLLSSRHNFNYGFYKEAIVFCQSFVETFLNALYVNILVGEGKSDQEIQTRIEELSFMSMIKKELHPRIGGNWNIEDISIPIGKWYSNTYLLRNRIVHAGYLPSFEEASYALDSAGKFRAFVIQQLKMKKQYQEILKYFHLL